MNDPIQSEDTSPPSEPTPIARQCWSLRKRIAALVAGLLVAYLAVAYVVVPAVWKYHAREHPSLESVPGITHTADGIPGDPVNVALIGTKAELIKIMLAAKWDPADPLSLRSPPPATCGKSR